MHKSAKTVLIAGTDTEVGKTVLTAGLVRWLNSKGIQTLAMKPFVCGTTKRNKKLIYSDIEMLKNAMSYEPRAMSLNTDDIAPLRWKAPLAPFRASILEKKPVDFKKVKRVIEKNKKKCDVLFIEGIGGLSCPLTKKKTLADWAKKEKLPVLLVARLGLGTLNHTLMTLEIARKKGLKIKGIILNDFPKTRNDLSKKWNRKDLEQLAKMRILGTLPYLSKLSTVSSHRALEKNFDFKKIKKII